MAIEEASITLPKKEEEEAEKEEEEEAEKAEKEEEKELSFLECFERIENELKRLLFKLKPIDFVQHS